MQAGFSLTQWGVNVIIQVNPKAGYAAVMRVVVCDFSFREKRLYCGVF